MLSSIDDFGGKGSGLGFTALAAGSSNVAVSKRKVGPGELLGEAAFFTEVRSCGRS